MLGTDTAAQRIFVLRHYADALLFLTGADAYTSYVFLRDLKLIDAVSVDAAQNTVAVDVRKLYPNIGLAETLSCLTGKSIRRITTETVEFSDGSSARLVAPDWELVRLLIWW